MSHARGPGRPAHPDVLTPAEWRVLEGVRHGLTNKTIATRMGVSVDAVKFHVANILSKLGLGRRTELRTWKGVRADSKLAKKRIKQGEIAIGPIGQIARRVSDVGAAARWFKEKLGLRHLYTFGELAFFDCGGTRLMLSKGDIKQNAIMYFLVPDVRVAHLVFEAKGIAFVAAPHLIHRHEDGTEEWMAFFNDLDGQPLAIMSRISPTDVEERQ